MQNNFRLIKGKFLNNSFKSLIRSLKGTQFSMDLTNHSKRFCAETDHTKNGALRVGTHDGVFHCDEILACYLLKQLPKYSDAEIIRTRDEKILNACDVVVDVGGVYDPSCDRYDHHQREFNQTLSSLLPNKKFNIKLSSAGLVYTHFGHTIIASLLNWNKTDLKTDLIFDKVYETFIQEIDAIDNGLFLLN